MAEEAEKAIRIIAFNGKATNWPIWSGKFLARSQRKGYKGILQGTEKRPTETGAKLTKKQYDTLNELAYEDLILSIDGNTDAGRVAFGVINNARSTEYPEGDAMLAWKRLVSKYQSKSAPSRLALREEFNSSKLKNYKEDPDVWLTGLEDL